MKHKLLPAFFIILLFSPALQAKTKSTFVVISIEKKDDGNPFLNAITSFVTWLSSLKPQLEELNNKATYSAVYDHLGLIAADLQKISDAKTDLEIIIEESNYNKAEIDKKINFVVSELRLLSKHLRQINSDVNQTDHPEKSAWVNKIQSGVSGKLQDMNQFKLYLFSKDGKLENEKAQLDTMKAHITIAIDNINTLKAQIKPLK